MLAAFLPLIIAQDEPTERPLTLREKISAGMTPHERWSEETDTFMQHAGEPGNPCTFVGEAPQQVHVHVTDGCEGCKRACLEQLGEWAVCHAIECGTGYCTAFDRPPWARSQAPVSAQTDHLDLLSQERPPDVQCMQKVSLTFHQIGDEHARCEWGVLGAETERERQSEYYRDYEAGSCEACASTCGLFEWCRGYGCQPYDRVRANVHKGADDHEVGAECQLWNRVPQKWHPQLHTGSSYCFQRTERPVDPMPGPPPPPSPVAPMHCAQACLGLSFPKFYDPRLNALVEAHLEKVAADTQAAEEHKQARADALAANLAAKLCEPWCNEFTCLEIECDDCEECGHDDAPSPGDAYGIEGDYVESYEPFEAEKLDVSWTAEVPDAVLRPGTERCDKDTAPWYTGTYRYSGEMAGVYRDGAPTYREGQKQYTKVKAGGAAGEGEGEGPLQLEGRPILMGGQSGQALLWWRPGGPWDVVHASSPQNGPGWVVTDEPPLLVQGPAGSTMVAPPELQPQGARHAVYFKAANASLLPDYKEKGSIWMASCGGVSYEKVLAKLHCAATTDPLCTGEDASAGAAFWLQQPAPPAVSRAGCDAVELTWEEETDQLLADATTRYALYFQLATPTHVRARQLMHITRPASNASTDADGADADAEGEGEGEEPSSTPHIMRWRHLQQEGAQRYDTFGRPIQQAAQPWEEMDPAERKAEKKLQKKGEGRYGERLPISEAEIEKPILAGITTGRRFVVPHLAPETEYVVLLEAERNGEWSSRSAAVHVRTTAVAQVDRHAPQLTQLAYVPPPSTRAAGGDEQLDCSALHLRLGRLPECHAADFVEVQISEAADDGSWGPWRTALSRATSETVRVGVADPYQVYRARAVLHADVQVEGAPTGPLLVDLAEEIEPRFRGTIAPTSTASWALTPPRTSRCRPALQWDVLWRQSSSAAAAGGADGAAGASPRHVELPKQTPHDATEVLLLPEQGTETVSPSGMPGGAQSLHVESLRCPAGCSFRLRPHGLRGVDASFSTAESRAAPSPQLPRLPLLSGARRFELRFAQGATGGEEEVRRREALLRQMLVEALGAASSLVSLVVLESRFGVQYLVVEVDGGHDRLEAATLRLLGLLHLAAIEHAQPDDLEEAAPLLQALVPSDALLEVLADGTAVRRVPIAGRTSFDGTTYVAATGLLGGGDGEDALWLVAAALLLAVGGWAAMRRDDLREIKEASSSRRELASEAWRLAMEDGYNARRALSNRVARARAYGSAFVTGAVAPVWAEVRDEARERTMEWADAARGGRLPTHDEYDARANRTTGRFGGETAVEASLDLGAMSPDEGDIAAAIARKVNGSCDHGDDDERSGAATRVTGSRRAARGDDDDEQLC